MNPSAPELSNLVETFVAGIYLGLAPVGIMGRKRGNMNSTVDEAIKTFDVALCEHKRNIYRRDVHEEKKKTWKDGYNQGVRRTSEPQGWIEYDKLPEYYGGLLKKCARSKRRNLSLIEGFAIAPLIAAEEFLLDMALGKYFYHEDPYSIFNDLGLLNPSRMPLVSESLSEEAIRRISLEGYRAGMISFQPEEMLEMHARLKSA